MSQMPDKIWLHKDTKYNTTEEVCAYQYEFAEGMQAEGIENFVEYVPKDTFIDKACEFIASNMRCDGYTLQTKAKFIQSLRKALENKDE